jgi:signal transduction histidine kinase
MTLQYSINILFFDDYYLYKVKDKLKHITDDIYTNIEKIDDDYLLNISENTDIGAYIMDSESGAIIPDIQRGRNSNVSSMANPLNSILNKIVLENNDGKIYYQEIENEKLNSLSMVSVIYTSKSKYIVLVQSMAPITDTINSVNSYFGISVILLLIMGLFMSIYISRSISKPITDLNKLALKMSKLKFGDSYTGNRKDEIGQLGNTLNLLSSKLSFSLDELNENNKLLKVELDLKTSLNREKNEFLSMVAHEIKTPVAVITSYLEAIRDSVNNGKVDKVQKYYDVILRQSNAIETIINDLIDYVKFESTKNIQNFERINIKSRLIDVVESLGDSDNKNYELDLQDNSFIITDKKLFDRIILNLITNGIKYKKEETKVFISTYDGIDYQYIKITNKVKNDNINTTRIFEPFYRESHNDIKGNGLGLAIVKKACEILDYGIKAFVENGIFNVIIEIKKDGESNDK